MDPNPREVSARKSANEETAISTSIAPTRTPSSRARPARGEVQVDSASDTTFPSDRSASMAPTHAKFVVEIVTAVHGRVVSYAKP